MKILIKDILEKIDYVNFVGSPDNVVDAPIELNLENKNPKSLMWLNTKNIAKLQKITHGVLVVPSEAIDLKTNKNCDIIFTDHPRKAFMQILNTFFLGKKAFTIHPSAIIHQDVKLGKNVGIGANVIIEQDCIIGDNTCIDHNTVIKRNTLVGSHVVIGSNNTIGGAGYGYEKNDGGEFEFIPHLGNVVIKDFVEIGNNTCIDRAVLGSTILEDNVKVDNLVHIAHGVHIGHNSMIIANSMVAGSVKIGKNVWVAPSASILNQKNLGDNSLIGMGAVVLKNVPEDKIFIGNPARDLKRRT